MRFILINHIEYIVSDSDNGIYDAMNKGIKYSTGNYLGILNSGDLYNPNALSIISKYLEELFILRKLIEDEIAEGRNHRFFVFNSGFYLEINCTLSHCFSQFNI